jgi:hypothetical protein
LGRQGMDLQALQLVSGKRWSFAKLAMFVCFVVACALLIGSLLMPSKIRPAFGDRPMDQPVYAHLSSHH